MVRGLGTKDDGTRMRGRVSRWGLYMACVTSKSVVIKLMSLKVRVMEAAAVVATIVNDDDEHERERCAVRLR